MTVTGPAMALQVRDRDEVLEPYSRCCAPEAHYQQVSRCVTASEGRRPESASGKTEGLDHWSKSFLASLVAAGPDSARLDKFAVPRS
jgi:hypothetical protein